MPEREVDHAVGVDCRLAQNVDIVEGAALHRSARRLDRGGGLIAAGKSDDLMAGLQELWDDGRANVARRAGNEDTHVELRSGYDSN
jgi:hypothetical protein